MVAEIGLAATVLALVAAIYAFLAALVAQRSHHENLAISARNAVLTASIMLLVAVAMLLVGLLHEHYEIAYVWMVTSPGTPPFFRLTALWGSQAGSLLFWSLLMSISASIAVFGNWRC